MKTKELTFSVIIIVVSTLFSLAAGEGILRLKNANMQNYDIEMWRYARELKRASKNPVLGHEHIPTSEAHLQSTDIRINADGLRGADLKPKQQGEKRVLFIGSSITLGWGVKEQQVLTNRLDKMFSDKGQKITVANAGIGNYNTVRYVERYLSKLTHLKPDVIVVQYFINDAEQLTAGGGNWFLRNSQLAVTLWIAFNRVFNASGETSLIDHYKAVYKKSAPGYKAMVVALARLGAYARDKNIKVVVAMTPDIHNLEKYPFTFIHDDIKRLANAQKFSFVDLTPSLSSKPSKSLWAMPGDPHPNGAGHDLMAKALYPVLTKLLASDTANSATPETADK